MTLEADELQIFSRHFHSKYADFKLHVGGLGELGRAVIEKGIQIYNLPISIDDVLDPPEATPVVALTPNFMVEHSRPPYIASSDLAAYPYGAQFGNIPSAIMRSQH
jgi:hypothetical protein